MTLKQRLNALHIQFPNLQKVEVGYNGYGDDFNDFWYFKVYTLDGECNYLSNDDEQIFRELCDKILFDSEEIASAINFDNDGGEGHILINLIDNVVQVDHGYYEQHVVPDQVYTVDVDWEIDDDDQIPRPKGAGLVPETEASRP